MYKKLCSFMLMILTVTLTCEIKTFDINDYVVDLENNRIELVNEDSIFKHIYKDSLRLSVITELLKYDTGVFPFYVTIDSMETVLIDDNVNIPKYVEKDKNNVQKYNNNPIQLGGRGTLRHKYYAVLESFPFIFKEDSLFFVPRIEYTMRDSFIIPKEKYSISEKIDLVIITSEEFINTFEKYKIFKSKLGLNTKIKSKEEIYLEYSGESNFVKIRNYIKDIYYKNDLEYVIIGGSSDVVPVAYGLPWDGFGMVPTDNIYSNLDKEIDTNGNGIYLELGDNVDYYSDVYVGRFPGNNGEELEAMIQKSIKNYTGELNQRSEFNKSAFLSGFNAFDDYDGENFCKKIKSELPDYFVIDSLYEESSEIFSQQELLNSLNLGYNIFYHTSHGDYNKIGQKDNNWAVWSDHFYNLTGISSLYLFASCHPGDISYSGLSQKAMINPNGGCINYLGSSANEYPYAGINFQTTFLNLVLKGRSIGESVALSNLLSNGNLAINPLGRYIVQSYNIQGDPSNKLFLREARDISILGINQFKKGAGTVNGVFNMVPNETLEITLISNGEIISTTSTDNQSFTLEYDNLFSDSVYVYYHSQECYLKEYGYQVQNNDSIEIEISNLSINDTNGSGIGEFGDNLNINFNLNVSVNNSGTDSLKIYIVENSDTDLDLLIDSVKIEIPSIGVLTPISIFDIVYNPLTRAKQDSSAQITMYFGLDDTIINQEELFIPVADPTMDLQSLIYSEDNVYPTFINPSQGTINKVDISLVEIIKENYSQVKTTKTLFNIIGLSTVSDDTLYFPVDSTKTYNFQITINDDYVYSTSDFKVNTDAAENIVIDSDYSPGKVNLNWTHDLIGDFKYNIYTDTSLEFLNPILSNFEPINGNKHTFDNDQSATLYVQVAVIDTNNVEFFRSEIKQIDFIPLYQNKFKISQYELYNPMYINGKLISSAANSSVSGINRDGSLINNNGIIHEAAVNGFSTSLQQGFVIGDVNGDGLDDMVNYSFNNLDSALIKVIDLTTGDLIASKRLDCFIMENAPVLVDRNNDGKKEILLSCFKGNVSAYVYLMEYQDSNLEIVSGFPILSNHNTWQIHSPSMLDLDNNGTEEIVFDNGSHIIIYDANTVNLIEDYSSPAVIQTSLSYCDYDDDGNIEIFALSESTGSAGNLYGYEFDGSDLVLIPEISGGIKIDMCTSALWGVDLLPPVSFSDFDDDGTVDIVVLSSKKLYVYDNQFNSRANFPIDLDPRIETNNSSAPSFGDFDGDTILDILFMDANFRVWCYSGSTGNILDGFPIQIEDIDRIEMTALPIMDLDGDNDLEFAIGTNNGVMLVYDYPTSTTRLDTYDKYRGDQFNSGLFGITLGAPTNIITAQIGTDLNISWDPVATATIYKIFTSDEPYSGFILLDETSNTNYLVLDTTDVKKFYYIVAVK